MLGFEGNIASFPNQRDTLSGEKKNLVCSGRTLQQHNCVRKKNVGFTLFHELFILFSLFPKPNHPSIFIMCYFFACQTGTAILSFTSY